MNKEKIARMVLVAEDCAADQVLIRRAFAAAGVPVRISEARDGEAALKELGLEPSSEGGTSPLPELLLLDLNLPRISGREILKAIRSSEGHKHLPVIVVSSSAHQDDVLWCYQNGCSGYVQKKAGLQEFNGSLKRLTDFWLGTAVLPSRPTPSRSSA